MAAIQLAKNVWILCVGALIVIVIALAIAGGVFGAGSTKATCESIHWQGGQCEKLKNEEWLEAHGLPASVAK